MLKKIVTKFQKNYFDIFFTIKYKWHNSYSRVNSKQKAWKTVSNIQVIDKIQREIKKNLRRFTIKIRNYYFWLLFVARKDFLKLINVLLGWLLKFMLKETFHSIPQIHVYVLFQICLVVIRMLIKKTAPSDEVHLLSEGGIGVNYSVLVMVSRRDRVSWWDYSTVDVQDAAQNIWDDSSL